MTYQFAAADLEVQHRIKHAFDPEVRFNPGKVFPTLRRCAELGPRARARGQPSAFRTCRDFEHARAQTRRAPSQRRALRPRDAADVAEIVATHRRRSSRSAAARNAASGVR